MSEDAKGGNLAPEQDPNKEAAAVRPAKSGFFSGLRSSFLAGVVVVAPIGITLALIYWFVTGPIAEVDAFVRRALPSGDDRFSVFLNAIPGLGVLIAFLAIIALGAFAKNFVGRAFIKAGEELLDSMPVVRNLYRFFKNVFETALQRSARSFKEVALIEYPSKGIWTVAFIVSDGKGEVRTALHDQFDDPVSVFVPTVPNPTSGFLLFVPKSRMKHLKMSVEDAAKMVFSLGLVVPDYHDADEAVRRLEELAAQTARERRPFSLLPAGRGKSSRNGSA